MQTGLQHRHLFRLGPRCCSSLDSLCPPRRVTRLAQRRLFRMLCWTEATLAGLEAATSRALRQQHLSDSQPVCKVCGGTSGRPQSRGKRQKRQLSIQVRAGASASADIPVGQGNGNGSGSGSGPSSRGGGGGSGGSSQRHAGGSPLKTQPRGSAAQTEEVILMDISGEAMCIIPSLAATCTRYEVAAAQAISKLWLDGLQA